MIQGMKLMQASALRKCFAGHTLLEDVNISIDAGEVVTLVGLNGCGKTTLLRILLGLEKPDSGEVTYKPALQIGYMPQRFPIDKAMPMTVHAYLRLSAVNDAVFTYYVEALNIETLLDKALSVLSGGELQRISLARAMMRKPELLVLDEPVQGVDMSGQSKLYRLIGSLAKEIGCAVLMVSHDLHLVMADTDRVLCLNRHICCSGTPHQVSQDPVFAQVFGEKIAKTFALYEHHHDHSHDMRGRVRHECGGHQGE